jgi:hypothetical protein
MNCLYSICIVFLEKNNCFFSGKRYLCTRKNRNIDSIAQQVEHIPFKDGVLGSSPSWITQKGDLDLLFMVKDNLTTYDAIFGIKRDS